MDYGVLYLRFFAGAFKRVPADSLRAWVSPDFWASGVVEARATKGLRIRVSFFGFRV